MGQLTIGSVVLVSFPYADLRTYKKRPAVVAALSSLDTVVLCQITSRQLVGVPAIIIGNNNFSFGRLPQTSYIRPDKLVTVDSSIASEQILGQLNPQTVSQLRQSINQLFL